MFKKRVQNYICIFFVFMPFVVFSQTAIWDGKKDFIDICKNIYYLEDANDKFTINNISSEIFKQKFIKSEKNIINFGFTDKSYWLKFNLKNNTNKKLLLELKQPYLPSADLYYKNQNGQFIKMAGGYNVSMEQRIVRHHTQVFPLPKNTEQFYLKIHILAHSVPITIWEQSKFDAAATTQKLIYGLVVGLFLFVMFNNLLLYFSLRSFIYLFYSISVFFFLANSSTTMDGYILYLFPKLDLAFWYSLLPILNMPIALLFAVYFLDTEKNLPYLFKIGWIVAIFMVIYLVIHPFLPRIVVFNINPIFVMFNFFFIGYMSFKSYKLGNRIAIYIFVAYVIFLVFVIIETSYIYTGSPKYFLEISHATTGMFIEAFIFSIALARKFEWERTLNQQEKLNAQSQIILKTKENEKIVREQNQMLEEQVTARTLQLNESKKISEAERQKSDALLLNILPAEIAEELRQTGKSTALNYELATVLFADIKDFTRISTQFSAETMVKELDYIFGAFDKIIEKHNIEKIKIIGDAYMCAGGIPISNKTNPFDVVNAALDIQEFMKNMRKERLANSQQAYQIRIGINSGPLVAGIIGIKKFTYDIWGDTVNLASRLESNGEVNKINVSENTYNLIKEVYDCEYRGKIDVKGKGYTSMYFIHGRKNNDTNFDLIEKKILKMLKKGLSPTLHYHGFPHTIDVINNVKYIAEKEQITQKDIHLLKMAALFHDLGFLETYSGHEEIGCKMAREMLPHYAIPYEQIEEICEMIIATKVPQTPKTLLEKILCDADLLYLGTDGFEKTGTSLFIELKENGKLKTEVEWNQLQVNFLKKHKFHTQYVIQTYNKKKDQNLLKIKNWLNENQIQ